MGQVFLIFAASRQAGLGKTCMNEWSQRPPPDNAQYSKDADTHATAGFEITILAIERQQTHALESAATRLVH
jgi:hypothetical protein